jgi:hypothetical protein
MPDRTIGFLTGKDKRPDADLLFASVQTLARAPTCAASPPTTSTTSWSTSSTTPPQLTYRKLLAHFSPAFMLGLTATPDRTDGSALLELCDDNLVARVGLVEGIARGLLCAFRYYGVRDELDFTVIPWRSGRFDLAALDCRRCNPRPCCPGPARVQSSRPQDPRALVFCASKGHADFIASLFPRAWGPGCGSALGATSAPRAASLDQLQSRRARGDCRRRHLQRGRRSFPTSTRSSCCGRPSRRSCSSNSSAAACVVADNKPFLRVIDFIGNHRSFLAKPQALLALTGHDVAPGDALRRLRVGDLELPPGCSIEIETDALDLLERVARLSPDDALKHAYRLLRDTHGRRPTARELLGAGVTMRPVSSATGPGSTSSPRWTT